MSDEFQRFRLTSRLAGDFILRWGEINGPLFEGDLTMAFIFTAVLQANVRAVAEDPDLNILYGDDRLPPDALRQPISVLALAASLNLPRETVRRYVLKLEKRGQLVRVEGGVMVPAAIVGSDDAVRSLKAQYANTRRLVLGLRAAGVDFAQE